MVFLSFGQEHHELALFQLATGEAPSATQPACTTWRGSSGASRSCRQPIGAESDGVPVEATIEHNVTRSVYFPDPDGNRVELYCDMWRTASRPCARSAQARALH